MSIKSLLVVFPLALGISNFAMASDCHTSPCTENCQKENVTQEKSVTSTPVVESTKDRFERPPFRKERY